MRQEFLKSKGVAHFLMVLLIISWGFEYTMAKYALNFFSSIQLVFFKYSIALIGLLVVKLIQGTKFTIKKKDIPVYIACAISGEILYFMCEYEAVKILPVSIVTIMLAFTPMLSIIIDRVIYKKKANTKIILGIIATIIGVAFIIGIDFTEISGKIIVGYLLCVGAVICWNCYNFITTYLTDGYDPVTLTVNQIICTILVAAPFVLADLPDFQNLTWKVVGSTVYLGLVSGAIGFLIVVYALGKLGPTINAVYANFLPVTTTIFGWILLGEQLSFVQILGGIVVIGAGYFVIKEKSYLEDLNG